MDFSFLSIFDHLPEHGPVPNDNTRKPKRYNQNVLLNVYRETFRPDFLPVNAIQNISSEHIVLPIFENNQVLLLFQSNEVRQFHS